MHLRGYFKGPPLEAAYMTAVLSIPRIGVKEKVEFLVDTGATKTTILDRDATALGIPYINLSRPKQPLLGLGGVVDTYVARDAEISFRAEGDIEHKVQLPELLVVRHRKADTNIMRIPSVLGRGILNEYKLIYDKRSDLVLVTDEP